MLKINVKDNELSMEVAGNIETITKEFCIAEKSLREKLDSDDKMLGLIFANTLVSVMIDSDTKDMKSITKKMVQKALEID